ncbi:MAG: glutathione S-transferase N-terminal domain-containing protein [Solirubrobacterales bacterium]
MDEPVLFRCPTPTDSLCSCGGAAKALKKAGVEFESRKVPYSKKKRPEIVELTGQKRVPVLVDGDEVIYDSRRIKQYVERKWSTK